MEIIKEYGLIFGRIFTIIPLMLFVTLFMGRRSIGEMPVFDFLIVLTLGAVVGADIADPKIEHTPTAFAVLSIGLIQKIFTNWTIRSRWFGKLVTFEPIIIIHNGKFIHKNLKKAKYSIDNILQMLQENQIFDINSVYLAVIEANGKLSTIEKAEKTGGNSISYPIIREGEIEKHVLPKFQLEEQWVNEQLREHQIDLKDVFLATINEQRTLNFTMYIEKEHIHLPPLHH